MEKIVADLDGQIDIFENDIEMYLRMFCESNNIQNMKAESQSVWNSCLRYIYKHIFKGTDILKSKDNLYNPNNSIMSNYNTYNYNLVLEVLDIYIHDMCMKYDKEVSIVGFSILTGIDQETIYSWGRSSNSSKLSKSGTEIYKKLRDFREESLSNKLVTGKQNPVGVLGVLNRHYQWNMPGVSRETSQKAALGASELPKLGQNQPIIRQIAQHENASIDE